MSVEIGFSLDERIRRSLEPLGGPLRIDAFLVLMARERAQRAVQEARAAQPAPRRAAATEPEREAGIAAGSRSAPAPSKEGPSLSDSAKLRAEVAAYIRRDDLGDANAAEVQEYMDFMGGGSLVPEEPAEE